MASQFPSMASSPSELAGNSAEVGRVLTNHRIYELCKASWKSTITTHLPCTTVLSRCSCTQLFDSVRLWRCRPKLWILKVAMF